MRYPKSFFDALSAFFGHQSVWAYMDRRKPCINQDDLQERAAQVLIMGNIYSAAEEEVLVWLGPRIPPPTREQSGRLLSGPQLIFLAMIEESETDTSPKKDFRARKLDGFKVLGWSWSGKSWLLGSVYWLYSSGPADGFLELDLARSFTSAKMRECSV